MIELPEWLKVGAEVCTVVSNCNYDDVYESSKVEPGQLTLTIFL